MSHKCKYQETLPYHLICGKCGSREIYFKIPDDGPMNDPDCGCNVSVVCENCAELSSLEDHNERIFK